MVGGPLSGYLPAPAPPYWSHRLAGDHLWLRTGRRGGTFEWGASPAVMRYFLQGNTYQPTADGTLQQVRGAGRLAFLPPYPWVLVTIIRFRRHWPLAWYARLNLMGQMPYNASWLPRFALELGVRYRPEK